MPVGWSYLLIFPGSPFVCCLHRWRCVEKSNIMTKLAELVIVADAI